MVNIKTLPLGAYQTNCYLVWGEGTDSVVVIDPGYEPEKILAEVARLGKSIALTVSSTTELYFPPPDGKLVLPRMEQKWKMCCCQGAEILSLL